MNEDRRRLEDEAEDRIPFDDEDRKHLCRKMELGNLEISNYPSSQVIIKSENTDQGITLSEADVLRIAAWVLEGRMPDSDWDLL